MIVTLSGSFRSLKRGHTYTHCCNADTFTRSGGELQLQLCTLSSYSLFNFNSKLCQCRNIYGPDRIWYFSVMQCQHHCFINKQTSKQQQKCFQLRYTANYDTVVLLSCYFLTVALFRVLSKNRCSMWRKHVETVKSACQGAQFLIWHRLIQPVISRARARASGADSRLLSALTALVWGLVIYSLVFMAHFGCPPSSRSAQVRNGVSA